MASTANDADAPISTLRLAGEDVIVGVSGVGPSTVNVNRVESVAPVSSVTVARRSGIVIG